MATSSPFKFACILLITILSGCASVTPPIPLDQQFWNRQKVVGVHIDYPEKTDFFIEGNVGLLDLAIIMGATSELRKQAEALDPKEFNHFVSMVEDKVETEHKSIALKVLKEGDIDLEKLGKFSKSSSGDTHYFKKDISSLKDQFQIDYLLTLKVVKAGFARTYYAMAPTSDPRAVFSVEGTLVDVSNNQMLWHHISDESQYTTAGWDEPPTFPGLTNSFYSALEAAKNSLFADMNAVAPLPKQDKTEPAKQAGADAADSKVAAGKQHDSEETRL